jgi:signal transduction histidine kinase
MALRLGHKLALSLSLAALLPVGLAATVAVQIVLGGLEDGLHEQTARQLKVGMNLVLRNVERLGGDAERLASAPGLAGAVERGAEAVREILAHEDPHLPSAFVQVADRHGTIVAERAVGGDAARYASVGLSGTSPIVRSALEYERRVTILPVGGMLVVYAVAPVVDPSFALEGAVVLAMPLDGDFADGIKGALGCDVLLHAGAQPAMSSFLDADGARLGGIAPPAGVAADILAGGQRQVRDLIDGRDYSLGYAPLKNMEGQHVGMFAVAVERGALARAQQAAARSLGLGAAGAVAFALFLAFLFSRRLTRPIARLHAGALSIARGQLDAGLAHIQAPEKGDEIGDLAEAFTAMTRSLRENQERLAARMREIVALHEAGRAVSSVLGLDEVLRKIVDSVARVLDTRLAALWLVDPIDPSSPEYLSAEFAAGHPVLRIGAARLKSRSGTGSGSASEPPEGTSPGPARAGAGPENPAWGQAACLSEYAAEVARTRFPIRVDDVGVALRWSEAARAAGIDGSLLGVPLERGNLVVGVLVTSRVALSPAFTSADEALLATFADQAATAIENARLYEEIRAFSEELEEKVRLRTRELTSINAELGLALAELRDTQSQLIHSERMAGLGALVAGVAHEINSPSAAIRGSVDALADNVRRLAGAARQLGELPMGEAERGRVLAVADELAPRLAESKVGSPAEVRRRARAVGLSWTAAGIAGAPEAARTFVELGAEDRDLDALVPLLLLMRGRHELLVTYVRESSYLYRNATSIQGAIKQIQRIVGALKSYSHLDQAKIEPADLEEGIENTLTLLHHELKYGIRIVRRFGHLPKIPVYVDELNQVWTNLIHNAVQALSGKGEIVLETEVAEAEGVARVRVIDNGPGIPHEILPRIFEPFFTTKAKGEGTGLGLGIVSKILEKHGGRVDVESAPGRTAMTVVLPLSGPPGKVGGGNARADERGVA